MVFKLAADRGTGPGCQPLQLNLTGDALRRCSGTALPFDLGEHVASAQTGRSCSVDRWKEILMVVGLVVGLVDD